MTPDDPITRRDHTLMLRPDLNITLTGVPVNLTAREAERIERFLRALVVPETPAANNPTPAPPATVQ